MYISTYCQRQTNTLLLISQLHIIAILLILDIDAALMKVMAINANSSNSSPKTFYPTCCFDDDGGQKSQKWPLRVWDQTMWPTSTLNHLLTPCGFSPVYFWQAATAAPTRLNNSSDENSAMISDSISVTCNPGKHGFHRNRITGRRRSLR